MTTLTKLIAEIDALDAKATPGPIAVSTTDPRQIVMDSKVGNERPIIAHGVCHDNDARKIAALWNNWPVLRARLLAQEKVVEAAKDVCDDSNWDEMKRLRDALSALDAEDGKGEA